MELRQTLLGRVAGQFTLVYYWFALRSVSCAIRLLHQVEALSLLRLPNGVVLVLDWLVVVHLTGAQVLNTLLVHEPDVATTIVRAVFL